MSEQPTGTVAIRFIHEGKLVDDVLPHENPEIRFRLPSGEVLDIRIDRDGLHVLHECGPRHGSLAVQPQASNVLRIVVVPRN